MNAVAATATAGDEERETRVALAACYRLLHLYGMTDLIYTHVSARLPGGTFLLNPYGLLFDEITASSLVEVDADGAPVGHGPWAVNPAGVTIHSAILGARADIGCALHTHTRAGVAVSAQERGLLPISQHALQFDGHLAYHDYEGIALDRDECPRLAADLGTHNAMILRNHGLLTVGATVADAFLLMYNLEMACRIQVDALTAPVRVPDQAVRAHTAAQYHDSDGESRHLAWAALLRRLDRECPDFRD